MVRYIAEGMITHGGYPGPRVDPNDLDENDRYRLGEMVGIVDAKALGVMPIIDGPFREKVNDPSRKGVHYNIYYEVPTCNTIDSGNAYLFLWVCAFSRGDGEKRMFVPSFHLVPAVSTLLIRKFRKEA